MRAARHLERIADRGSNLGSRTGKEVETLDSTGKTRGSVVPDPGVSPG